MRRMLVLSAAVIAGLFVSSAMARGPWGPGPYGVLKRADGTWIVTDGQKTKARVLGRYKSAEAAGAAAREANRRVMVQRKASPHVGRPAQGVDRR
ncbi:MAG: hypothetical protein R3E48_08330 [Burkholderiaceae bacterium]